MDILDKIGAFAKNVGEKTEDMIETGKLNLKINAEERAISEQTEKLGAWYLERLDAGMQPEAGAAEIYAAITASRALIEEIKAEIKKIQEEKETPAAEETVPAASACPACGTACAAGVKFCPNCGARLEAEPPAQPAAVCPACGRENAPEVRFCRECGAQMAE